MFDQGSHKVRSGAGWSTIPAAFRSVEEEAIRNVEATRDRKQAPEHVHKNCFAIMKYLELWPTRAEPSLMGSDEPYKHKSRGSSRPPTPDGGLRFMGDEGLGVEAGEDSIQALAYLRHSMRDLTTGGVRIGGIAFREVLLELWRDPGAAAKWETARARNGSKEEKAMQQAFYKFSLLLAWVLERKFSDALVTVGSEEQRERAATQRAYNVERKVGKEYALGVIGRAILRYKEDSGCGIEEAVQRFMGPLKGDEQGNHSRARCWEAIKFVREEA